MFKQKIYTYGYGCTYIHIRIASTYTCPELLLSLKRFCNVAPDRAVSRRYRATNQRTLLKYHLAGKMMLPVKSQQSGICRHTGTA